MKRRTLLLMGVASLASLTAFAADEKLPKGFDVLDAYTKATGGEKAYSKHHSEVAAIGLEIIGKGIKGSGTRYTDESNNSLETLTIEGIGKIDAGVYKGVAWEVNAITGPRLLEGPEKTTRLRDSRFNAPLHNHDLYKTAETVSVEDIDGEPCYKVLVTPVEGSVETDYFSKKTGLLKKKTMTLSTQMGEVPVEVLIGSYEEYDGVKTPKVMTQKVMGAEMQMSITSVKYNEEIPADRFEPPAEIKKLMAK